MPKGTSPYIKAVKKGSVLELTVMAAVPGGHVLGARGSAPVDDPLAIAAEVERLVIDVRARFQRPGRQADGNR